MLILCFVENACFYDNFIFTYSRKTQNIRRFSDYEFIIFRTNSFIKIIINRSKELAFVLLKFFCKSY